MRISTLSSVAAVTFVVIAATGCTPQSPAAPPVEEPPLGNVAIVTSRTQVVPAPLLEYKTSVDEQFAIQRAVTKLSAECMARFDVVATPVQNRREDIAAARGGAANRYGPVTVEESEETASPPPAPEKDRRVSAATPADPRESELMTGQDRNRQPSKLLDKFGAPVPKYGCGREGFDKLGYRPDDILFVDGLLNDAWTMMRRDSRYIDIQAKWSACMKERGFNLKERGEPSKTQAEIQRRALPDVECARNINYVGVMNALDIAYQKRIIAQNSATLTGVRENNQLMASRAQEFLHG